MVHDALFYFAINFFKQKSRKHGAKRCDPSSRVVMKLSGDGTDSQARSVVCCMFYEPNANALNA